MADYSDLIPANLRASLSDGTRLKPSITTSAYTGGTPSAANQVKRSVVYADGTVKPSMAYADGTLKPSVLIAGGGGAAVDPDAFILTVETTGASETMEVQGTGTGYSYDIDWGDGTVETSQTAASPSHVYASAGTHTIKITGTFPRIYVNNNATYKTKYRTVEQWGDVGFTSMSDAFESCINLVLNDKTLPDVADYTRAFQGCLSLILDDDYSFAGTSGTNFSQMFPLIDALSANGNVIPANFLDAHSPTNLTFMFSNAGVQGGDFGTWDWTAVTGAGNFLLNCTINTTDYNASLVGIESQAVQNSVNFHGGSSVATGTGLTARTALINDHSWTITDGTP
jgi:PKD repeat protein